MFRKKKTYEFENKLGKFEVDEYRDFYVVKKKLTGKNKGFYDPTSMVVAKKDPKMPIFPDRDFARVFGDYNAVMFYFTGIKGKDHFQDEMKRIASGEEHLICSPLYWKEMFGEKRKDLLK
jgi:hypothetical protein